MHLKLLLPFDQLKKWTHRLLCQRRCTLTKALLITTLLTVISFFVLNYHHGDWTTKPKKPHLSSPPAPITTCNLLNKAKTDRGPNNHDTRGNLRIGRKVLIMVDSPFSRNAKNIAASMEYSRYPYKIVDDEKNLPTLIHMGKGRFGVIIFETMALYLSLDAWNRQLIDKYCREYNVGVIFFMKPKGELEVLMENVQDFSFSVQYNVALKDYSLNAASKVWRITKPGEVIKETFPEEDWAVFYPNHSTFEPLAFATQTVSLYDDYDPSSVTKNKTVYPAILDTGKNDGIQRVFFGHNFSFWLHSLLLLDSISFLSHGKLSLGLERHIQIDIDDIFVGAKGTRMKAHDVVALYEAQERLQEQVDGFRFMLGFSGWYYQHGTEEENAGDQMLL
ncbi:bifunctional heparan sulfate N-deacetylase/N-sulfotransferase-like, partial [Mercenaria mercenaria]|uniref:bifunctional heparan sulfate N-deacetylase/N-sulfotransferase-like n=1 Tax=Mercenaria mercenaria TaxID=6596 RepID=UPI00234EC7F6